MGLVVFKCFMTETNNRKRKYNARIAVIALAGFFLVPRSHAYEYKTHGKAATETAEFIRGADKGRFYAELYDPAYIQQMSQGAEDEDFGNVDENNRAFRHFYDPDQTGLDKGLKFQDYFSVWYYADLAKRLGKIAERDYNYENVLVTRPASGYYDNALEWARNGAESADRLNWEGAIEAYDYTGSSKEEAYLRLGHVLHLLQDMAEPDHIYCLAHPGSSYSTTRDGVLYYGYEGLVESRIDHLNFPGKSVQKHKALDDYFNEMARQSKEAVTGNFVVPLGLEYVNFSFSVAPGLKAVNYRDVPLLPHIDSRDAGECAKYIDLAVKLLSKATGLNAGLMEHFYDIVNPPPYVRRVSIAQDTFADGEPGEYESELEDIVKKDTAGIERAVRRRPNTDTAADEPFMKGEEATILIEFGPEGKVIDPATVKVIIADKEIKGAMTDVLTWEGSFIPELPQGTGINQQDILITCRDAQQHYPRLTLPPKGYELDASPESPARIASVTEPYEWKDYHPAPDGRHRITVYDAEETGRGRSVYSRRLNDGEFTTLYVIFDQYQGNKKRYGFEDACHNNVIPMQYDDAQGFAEELAGVKVNGKWGFIDTEGNMVIAPRYDNWPGPFSEGLARVTLLDEETGAMAQRFIDKTGKVVIDLYARELEAGGDFHEGLAPFKSIARNSSPLYGYLDKQGNVAIKPAFKAAQDFSEGLAPVILHDGNKFGFINRRGKVIIQPQFDQVVAPFAERKALVRLKGAKSGRSLNCQSLSRTGVSQATCAQGDLRFINRKGRILEGVWFEVKPGDEFFNSRALVTIEGKYGFINEKGHLVIDARFDNARPFSEGLAEVETGGKWGFIDAAGEFIMKPEFGLTGSFKNGIAKVGTPGQIPAVRYIDATGRAVNITEDAASLEYREGLAARVAEGPYKIGYVDKHRNFVIAGKFEYGRPFFEGLAHVAERIGDRELVGYIDKKGSYVIKPRFGRIIAGKFEDGIDFSEGLVAVALPDTDCRGYIDKRGNWAIKPQFDLAGPFIEGTAYVRSHNGYGCIDKTGKVIRQRWWKVYGKKEL